MKTVNNILLAMLVWMFLAGLSARTARGQSPSDFKYTSEGGTITITGLAVPWNGPLTIPDKI